MEILQLDLKMTIKNIQPKLLARDNEHLVSIECDARQLLNWVEQMRRGTNYSTDFMKPMHLTLLGCVKEECNSILNHIKNIEDENYVAI